LKSNKNKPGFISKLKERAANLQRDVYALWFAYRDARTPLYAKGFAALVVAYAFSPIDLIPDFIPVLGYLDDLILVPAGIALALKMIPAEVMSDARVKADQHLKDKKPTNWVVAGVIILIWIAILAWVGITIWNAFPRK
jgi:uncharacterized membrane protein YkvA (DUF1232 family)